MAGVTPGAGATVNATTIEGQLWQMVHLINFAEKELETQKLNITKSDDFILEGDFTIPAQASRETSTGVITASAAPYLASIPFTPGTGTSRTFLATTLSQYFIDVIGLIVFWQNISDKNPKQLTNCTLNLDFNVPEYSGTIILPYSSALAAGGTIVETATEWLV
jgi:hypothetical protein